MKSVTAGRIRGALERARAKHNSHLDKILALETKAAECRGELAAITQPSYSEYLQNILRRGGALGSTLLTLAIGGLLTVLASNLAAFIGVLMFLVTLAVAIFGVKLIYSGSVKQIRLRNIASNEEQAAELEKLISRHRTMQQQYADRIARLNLGLEEAERMARDIIASRQSTIDQENLRQYGFGPHEAEVAELRARATGAEAYRYVTLSASQILLSNQHIEAMRGYGFEDFLAKVGRVLGYEVETVGKAGDQGVDLVFEINGERWAIQAKGYSGAVNNSAVQEVVAGMRYWRCNRCAVITNSSFTKSAHQLAAANCCSLIDGNAIRDWIAEVTVLV